MMPNRALRGKLLWVRAQLRRSFGTASQEHASGVVAGYLRLVADQALVNDDTQLQAAHALQALHAAVVMRALVPSAQGQDASVKDAQAAVSPGGVCGAYLHGPVGSGKTMLVDLFCAITKDALRALPKQTPLSPASACRWAIPGFKAAASSSSANGHGTDPFRGVVRQHFHEFMLEVHARLHALHAARARIVGQSRQGLPVFRYADSDEDPLLVVAGEVAARAAVLCLDELHVTDVADALVLSRLLRAILGHGTVVLFTSNRKPGDLYKGGLSYSYPFVECIEKSMLVLRVAGGHDYRLLRSNSVSSTSGSSVSNLPSSITPAGPRTSLDGAVGTSVDAMHAALMYQARSHMAGHTGRPQGLALVGAGAPQLLEELWVRAVTGGDTCSTSPAVYERGRQLDVGFGRTVWVPRTGHILLASDVAAQDVTPERTHNAAASAPGATPVHAAKHAQPQHHDAQVQSRRTRMPAAHFTFQQLCGRQGLSRGVDQGGALAAPDFLAICNAFPCVFISDIPQLLQSMGDEVRRLVTLLDIAYESRVQLVVSSAVPPTQLFQPVLQAAYNQGINPNLGLAAGALKGLDAFKQAACSTTAHTGGPEAGKHLGTGQLPDAAFTQPGMLQPPTGSWPPRPGAEASAGVEGLSPETVIMLHRATSRMSEMMRVVGL